VPERARERMFVIGPIFGAAFIFAVYAVCGALADKGKSAAQGFFGKYVGRPIWTGWKGTFIGKPAAFKAANCVIGALLMFLVFNGLSYSCVFNPTELICNYVTTWHSLHTKYQFWCMLFVTFCVIALFGAVFYPGTLIIVNDYKIPVTTSCNLDVETVKRFKPFKDWCEKLGQDSKLKLKHIEFQNVDMFGPTRIGFLKFKATVFQKEHSKNKPLPGIVFMRGPSMAVLMLVKCGGELYAIMTRQPRLAVPTTSMAELPAGILNKDGNFQSEARDEITQTTGIIIDDKNFRNMTEMVYGTTFPGVYPSCGGSDEFIQLYLYQHPTELNGGSLVEMLGPKTLEKGKKLCVVPMTYENIITQSADTKTVCAVHLFEKLVQEEQITPLVPLSVDRSRKAYEKHKSSMSIPEDTGTLIWDGQEPQRPQSLSSQDGVSVCIAEKWVPLRCAEGQHIDLDVAKQAIFFEDWLAGLKNVNHPKKVIDVESVEIQSMDMFGKNVGFLKIKAEAMTEHRHQIPGSIVFLRGGAVGIFMLLKCQGELFVVLCNQARIPVASSEFIEIPAGKLDGKGAFAGYAAAELKEETSIQVDPKALIDMTQKVYESSYKGIYASCGGSDEFYRFFLGFQEVDFDTLGKLKASDQARGSRGDGEAILLKIVPYKQLLRATSDCKTLLAACLYEKLMEWGELPKHMAADDSGGELVSRTVSDPSDLAVSALRSTANQLHLPEANPIHRTASAMILRVGGKCKLENVEGQSSAAIWQVRDIQGDKVKVLAFNSTRWVNRTQAKPVD